MCGPDAWLFDQVDKIAIRKIEATLPPECSKSQFRGRAEVWLENMWPLHACIEDILFLLEDAGVQDVEGALQEIPKCLGHENIQVCFREEVHCHVKQQLIDAMDFRDVLTYLLRQEKAAAKKVAMYRAKHQQCIRDMERAEKEVEVCQQIRIRRDITLQEAKLSSGSLGRNQRQRVNKKLRTLKFQLGSPVSKQSPKPQPKKAVPQKLRVHPSAYKKFKEMFIEHKRKHKSKKHNLKHCSTK